jgi:hypothetical protein
MHEIEKLGLALGTRRVLPKIRQIARSHSDQDGGYRNYEQDSHCERNQPSLWIEPDARPDFYRMLFDHNRILASLAHYRFAPGHRTNNRKRDGFDNYS